MLRRYLSKKQFKKEKLLTLPKIPKIYFYQVLVNIRYAVDRN